jgi:GNAT superfamily N-acetyltransferase
MVTRDTNSGNREGLMVDRWFAEIELSISFEQFEKLPTNPAYKYEYFDDKAWLSPRPKECHALLALQSWKGDQIASAVTQEPVSIRPLEAADWERLDTLFSGAFQRVQPFASLSDAQRLEAARDCLRFTYDGGDGPVIEPACFVIVDQEYTHLRGAILVTLMPDVDLSESLDLRWRKPPPPDWAERRIGRPHLTWIFVGHRSREQGFGSSLLAAATGALREMGYHTLASTFLVGNDASALWHWRNGFQLVGRPHSLRKLRSGLRR